MTDQEILDKHIDLESSCLTKKGKQRGDGDAIQTQRSIQSER